ncbi:hypothetical protein [Bacillus phage vB_BanS-Thrax3]|nr:hypothetical protein [Bacillus phage vB_BanS-Thrax1]UUV46605.1 hypothetical protein [Bacillus phage vB_BanS-Thrax3]
MIFLISLIVYIVCVYIGVKFAKNSGIDKEKILSLKEKLVVLIWFTFFISSQMGMISQLLKWIGLIL